MSEQINMEELQEDVVRLRDDKRNLLGILETVTSLTIMFSKDGILGLSSSRDLDKLDEITRRRLAQALTSFVSTLLMTDDDVKKLKESAVPAKTATPE